MTIGYVLNKIKCKFLRKKGPETCEIINHYFKKKGTRTFDGFKFKEREEFYG